MHKILLVFGTRPELIKMAPVIREFHRRDQRHHLYIVNTGQHNLLSADIDYFQIDVDREFKLTRDNDSLSLLNGLLLLEFDQLRSELKDLEITINAVISQGDTCTSFAAAQFSFYERIPFIHIEAGLRTGDFNEPFPEEFFRKTMATMASVHFAPTPAAAQNLLNEGIDPENILVTGNTGIDNLRNYLESENYNGREPEDIVLITMHRRENIKQHLATIIDRVVHYCESNPEKTFLWIDNPGYKIESDIGIHPANLKIIPPVSFSEMPGFYKRTQLIITDSGGIQEEAGYLGIPSLLFRTKTERIEGINMGISKYLEEADSNLDLVISELNKNRNNGVNTLYGDGLASKRIVDFLDEKGFDPNSDNS